MTIPVLPHASIRHAAVAAFAMIGWLGAGARAAEQTGGWTLSQFGIGACNQTSQNLPKWVPQMAAIGLTTMRTARVGWGDVEPEEGMWRWDKLDEQMAYLTENHIAFGGLLYGNARWDKLDRGGTLPVNNLPAWSAYVTEAVKHCKGQVKYWELWNEPPNGTGRNQTPADYAKLMVATYDAAKAADPTCMVGLAAKSVHVNYLEQTIKAGAKGHFDYIILHPYEVLNGVADNAGSEAVFMSIVPTVRKMLAAQDPDKTSAPIIFTELGSDARKGADNQAHALVKAYSMGIAQGVACIEWFEGMDGDSGPMGLLKGDGTPRPSYTALGQMIQHLGQHPAYLGWVLLDGKDYGFVFQGAKGTVLCTWAPKGAPQHIDFGQAVQIVDPLTGMASNASAYDLSVAPILVIGVPDRLVAQAKTNKALPFPWGGDFSGATSVSVSMGEKNTEKGLHTMSGDSVAAAVVAYGGSARAGDVPGGNVFMVDPNFLSYAATPIEISVVIRRDAANHPTKLTLEYESTTGYKKLPPFEVPDSADWSTASWRIDDAQFVSMWGFNFRYNSGKYLVQSVTVKKVP